MTEHDDNKRNFGKEGLRRMFATDIATDLAEGRVLELAEIYALDALSDAERAEIDNYIATAPERSAFLERVRQSREALTASFADEAEPRPGSCRTSCGSSRNNHELHKPAQRPRRRRFPKCRLEPQRTLPPTSWTSPPNGTDGIADASEASVVGWQPLRLPR
ncbi:conserved hypothetical protein [Arthrobacter sp. Hiyo8]|nr:conserved hypothetical protein [Arthrobacter sp. Hiyo8]